jgi:hypothetical protein
MPSEIRDATAAIARYEINQSRITGRGWAGLESVEVNELKVTMPRQVRGAVTAQRLDELVPEAADLLAGFKFWRAA